MTTRFSSDMMFSKIISYSCIPNGNELITNIAGLYRQLIILIAPSPILTTTVPECLTTTDCPNNLSIYLWLLIHILNYWSLIIDSNTLTKTSNNTFSRYPFRVWYTYSTSNFPSRHVYCGNIIGPWHYHFFPPKVYLQLRFRSNYLSFPLLYMSIVNLSFCIRISI